MRILLLMDPFIPVPPIHYGGIERVIFDIANQYHRQGHEVSIVAGPNSASPGRLITYGENGPLNEKFSWRSFAEVYSIISKEIKNHDVLHNFGRLAFLVPFLKSKKKKLHTYMRYVDKKNIERLDLINPVNLHYTAVSNAIVETGKTKKSQWHTVYNCAPIESFNYNQRADPENYLAFLGRIERCKGLHNAITVAKLTGRKLIIAGNISDLEHERIYFENEIKPQIDENQIQYIGPVDNVRKNKLLGGAAALLTPIEWFEPFPIIIPEAYACGTPVLGFKNGGVPEGIDEGVTGFVSTNCHEMAAHVAKIASINRLNCRKKAENDYSDKKIAEDYFNIYTS